MAKDKETHKILTPEFRVAWPSVFEPSAAVDGGKLKYRVTMIFPKTTNIDPIKQLILGAVAREFGADRTKWPTKKTEEGKIVSGLHLPIRDGAEKDYDGFGPGIVFCAAASKFKPGLVDQNVQDIITPSEFYPGCYARATISPYVYEYMGKHGVTINLHNIQKTRDGEPLKGGSSPKEDFDEIPVPAGSAAEMAGAAGGKDAGLKDPFGM